MYSVRQVTVSPLPNDTSAISTMSVNSTIRHTVVNMLTDLQKASGTLSAMGGTINLNSLPADMYLLRLDTGNGNAQTFKIKLN